MAKSNKIQQKITPYKFPTARHARTENPRLYKQYASYKSSLIDEFSLRCVYCRSPLAIGGRASAAVEHYRPKKEFPHLQVEYSNLFLSCLRCNSFKGTYWREEEEYRIVNPCDDIMSQHLNFVGSIVGPSSDRGKVHIALLKLNDDDRLSDREIVLTAIRLAVDKLLEVKKQSAPTQAMLASADKVLEFLEKYTAVNETRLRKLLT